jgi:serine/threonine protein kinase, bacterial
MSLNLYPIAKQLGEGGFGTTYLATNTLMPSRPYCVVKKLIPTSADPGLQQLIQDRFKQEAITLENLGKGSNGMIPMLYHYFVEQDEFYLVQEYIDGQTLTDRVDRYGVFTEAQVRQFFNDILPTLNYVHQKGIIHRDIKPDNIMMRQIDNKPILIDFGAVKEIMGTVMTPSANTAKSIVIGTPGFMPIEQMTGRPMFASDIYALGLTAIYLLTAKIPTEIEADPHTGNMNWQIYAPNISPQLAAIIDRSIEPAARDRYPNTLEMLQALNTSSSQQIPATTVISPPPDRPQQTVYIPAKEAVDRDRVNEKSQTNPVLMTLIGVAVGCTLIVTALGVGKIFSTNNSSQDRTEDPKIVSNSDPSIKPIAPVLSPPSSAPNPPTISATDIVKDYYTKINNRDYQGAWNALPFSLQNDRSIHPNGYNSFLDWWSNQVGSVQLLGINLVSETDRSAIVDADIKYFMRSGKSGPTSQAMRYFFFKNTSTNSWAIDKIRLR